MNTNKSKATLAVFLLSAFLVASQSAIGSTSGAQTPTSLIIDFSITPSDTELEPGESNIINVAIKNTGGQPAEAVKLTVSGTGSVIAGGGYYIGDIPAGDTKTVPITVRASTSPQTRLSRVNVMIYYTGFDSNGNSDRTYDNWQIPVFVDIPSMFSVETSTNTLFEGAPIPVTFSLSPSDNAFSVYAEFESDCATVIGSSKVFLGDIVALTNANDELIPAKDVTFALSPTGSDSCTGNLKLDYITKAGSNANDEIPIGFSIGDSPVDFKITGVNYSTIVPGGTTDLEITLKNGGSFTAEDTTISFELKDPFVPIESSEVYIGDVAPDETVTADFKMGVTWDAETTIYSMTFNICYKLTGTEVCQEKMIGVDVVGDIILEIIGTSSTSSGLSVEVANLGTRSADAIVATYYSGNQGATTGEFPTTQRSDFSGKQNSNTTRPSSAPESDMPSGNGIVDYKSDIKAGNQGTFTFTGASSTEGGTVVFEYTGAGNQRITQVETLPSSSGGSSATTGDMNAKRSSSGGFGLVEIAIIIVVVITLYYAYRKKYFDRFLKREKGSE